MAHTPSKVRQTEDGWEHYSRLLASGARLDSHPPLVLSQPFRDLPDPWRGPLCEHDLLAIIAIAICAGICGQHSWTDIELYGETHHDWLKTFLRLPNGIPSHDTFRYVFTRLEPLAFQRCFASWIAALSVVTGLQHIARVAGDVR